jgi:hypothetical protein
MEFEPEKNNMNHIFNFFSTQKTITQVRDSDLILYRVFKV